MKPRKIAARLLSSETFDRDAVLERNGFDETMVSTAAFERVWAAGRRCSRAAGQAFDRTRIWREKPGTFPQGERLRLCFWE